MLALILAEDTTEPPIFNPADRQALRAALYVVAEAEVVFAKLRKLRSRRGQRSWEVWLCTSILAAMRWYESVKSASGWVAGVDDNITKKVPHTKKQLMTSHRVSYHKMREASCRPDERLSLLLWLIRLELMWFALTW